MTQPSTPLPDPQQARKTLLDAVRGALGHEATQPPAEPLPEVDEAIVRRASTGDDLPAMFAQRADEVGMHVYRVAPAELDRRVAALLTELDAHSVAIGLADAGRAGSLADVLRQGGCELVDWRGEGGIDRLYDTDVGITDAVGIAESGSLVCATDAGHARALSLVPPIYVAVVRASELEPDLLDVAGGFEHAPADQRPSSVAIITGPSKTADIEGILIVGVHGPGQVHIFLVA